MKNKEIAPVERMAETGIEVVKNQEKRTVSSSERACLPGMEEVSAASSAPASVACMAEETTAAGGRKPEDSGFSVDAGPAPAEAPDGAGKRQSQAAQAGSLCDPVDSACLNPTETTSSRIPAPQITVPSSELYDAAELRRIAELIYELLRPVQIRLFGARAGALPHGDTAAYDLLVVTPAAPLYSWEQLRYYLQLRLDDGRKLVNRINCCVCSRNQVQNEYNLFFRHVLNGSVVLYDALPGRLRQCNYVRFAAVARSGWESHFETGAEFLRAVYAALDGRHVASAAFMMEPAALQILQALHMVWYGVPGDVQSPGALFVRLRTLSAELTLLLETPQGGSVQFFSRLEKFSVQVRVAALCEARVDELSDYAARLGAMREMVFRLCRDRIALYENLGKKDDSAASLLNQGEAGI